MGFSEIDWADIFVPQSPLAGVIVRGTLTYFMLFLILRFLLKRQSGVIGIADLLVVVLIADAAQNAMANEYKSIIEGALLVLTIVFWNYFLDWLGYRFPIFQRFVRPPSLRLIENGRMLRQIMRQEMITPEELNSQLRQQGSRAATRSRKPSSRATDASASSRRKRTISPTRSRTGCRTRAPQSHGLQVPVASLARSLPSTRAITSGRTPLNS